MLIKDLMESSSFSKLPPFLKTHGVWNNIKRIKKPFPEIGLPNCLEKLNHPSYPNRYIGFTSSGIKGLWDLATMSMRGVCSCMHWKNNHSIHLVGSVTCPFLGMVYLSDNTLTPYGISIKNRALIRVLHSQNTDEFSLVLERTYLDTGNTNPTVYNNRNPNEIEVLDIFKSFISKKVDPKFKVETYRDYPRYVTIPPSTSLRHMTGGCHSMSDSSFPYYHGDMAQLSKSSQEFLQPFSKQD